MASSLLFRSAPYVNETAFNVCPCKSCQLHYHFTLSLKSFILQNDFSMYGDRSPSTVDEEEEEEEGEAGSAIDTTRARRGIPLTPLILEKSVDRQLKRTNKVAPTCDCHWMVILSNEG